MIYLYIISQNKNNRTIYLHLFYILICFYNILIYLQPRNTLFDVGLCSKLFSVLMTYVNVKRQFSTLRTYGGIKCVCDYDYDYYYRATQLC